TATGLASATQYFWRVRATNPAGNSEWSQTWSFTTQAEGLIPGLLDGLEDITKAVDDILGNITSRLANEEPEYGAAEQKESSSVATGLPQLQKEYDITMYPNPVDDYIILEFKGEIPESMRILVYDQLGKIHLDKETEVQTPLLDIQHLRHRLIPGVYYLRIQTQGQQKVFKFLKK
ncbi:MAG TPA: T9SS type A sorting domain-containing protein, partial [Cyclobacteriaceae bacterium]|nr:T9SS type A sorting domain-containing protein [Cyclobacteriaceae bacterium]